MERTSLFLLVLVTSSVVSAKKDPVKGDGQLSFLAIGDAGGSHYYPYFTRTLKRVAKQMGKTAKATSAKFVIGLGDNFYWNGVKDVHDSRFQSTFEEIFRAPSLHWTTWYMLGGNHDYLGNISAQIAYTKRSKRWYFPDFYYTKVHKIPGSCKSVQVVTIDSNLLCYKRAAHFPTMFEQYEWIEDTLKKSDADYLVVAGHHPLYSVGMHGSNDCLRDKLKPLLDKYRVTAYFSGHDHNMQHIKPSDSAVHYFVSGSASNHNSDKHAWKTPKGSLKFFDGKHGGFTLLQATPKSLEISFINDRGEILHSTSIPPRYHRRCSDKKSYIPLSYDDLDEDSVLDAFFGLQEEEERRKRAQFREHKLNLVSSNMSKLHDRTMWDVRSLLKLR